MGRAQGQSAAPKRKFEPKCAVILVSILTILGGAWYTVATVGVYALAGYALTASAAGQLIAVCIKGG